MPSNTKRRWSLVDAVSGRILVPHLVRAEGWFRYTGLIGRAPLGEQDGLWFHGCRAIHTVGLRFAIDAIFLDEAGRVLAVESRIPSWTPYIGAFRARDVIELPAGGAGRNGLALDQALTFTYVE